MSGVVEAAYSLEGSAEASAEENNFLAESEDRKENKGTSLFDRGRDL